MNNNTDAGYIRQCMELIEARWQRGPSSDWKSYDFEKLSGEIFDATGESLSISTLKRLFGKVSYHNLPSVYTLNVLARFAGFADWTAFKMQERVNGAHGTTGSSTSSEKTTPVAVPSLKPLTHRFRTVTNLKKNWAGGPC